MFDATRTRRWLFSTPALRTNRCDGIRLHLFLLEDRLPPGDVFLTGLFTGGLSEPDDFVVPDIRVDPTSMRLVDWFRSSRVPGWGGDRAEAPADRPDTIRPPGGLTRTPLVIDVPQVVAPVPSHFFLPPWVGVARPADTGAFVPSANRVAIVGNSTVEVLFQAPPEVSSRLSGVGISDTAATPVPVAGKVAGDTGKLTRSFTRTEILVGVRGDNPLAAIREWAVKNPDPEVAVDWAASRVLLTVDDVSTVEVRLATGADPLAAVGRFAGMPRAAWAEPNYVFYHAKDWTPNDPSYTAAGQYFHTKSQTDLAWDLTKGSPTVLVGIADDGVGYNHPDLAPNMWANPGETPADGIDNDANGYVDDVRGWDFNANDNNPLPSGSDTHGTHVAGIVAARSNNAIGVAGTAGGDAESATTTGARLVNLRWNGAAGWTATMISNTYKYAADNGVKIVNASYNFDGWAGNATVDAALTYAYDKGVLLMNSAGNNGSLGAPRGVFTQPLFVASLDASDKRSDFSNYGAFVDVAAHGDGILSTTTSSNGTGVNYEVNSGTSMATPHAAGVAALIWSQNPTWTRDQVAAQLLGTTDSVDGVTGNAPGTLGTGRVNAYRGVTQSVAPPVFQNFTLTPVTGNPNQVASVAVTAPRRLAAASVTAANFELRSDGADNTFDTTDDVLYPVTINGGTPYRMGTNELTFTRTGGGPLPIDRYRLSGFSGPTQLRDPFGTALDGDSNGTAGGHFVALFGGNPQITGGGFEDTNGNGVRNANDLGLAGRTLYLDLNGNGAFDSGAASFPNNTPVSIPDQSTVTSQTTVTGVSGPITDVNVTVNITHEYNGDLDVYLIAPDGTRAELFTDVGGAGQNFTDTTLDDEAALAITAGAAPFTGSFRPEGSLAAFDGLTANGQWTLEITDDAGQDVGTLNGWTLTIATGVPEPNTTTDAGGNYAFLTPPTGTYAIRAVAPSGWTSTAPTAGGHPVTVTGPADVFNGRDFGQAKDDRFYGFVWDDRNANGALDAGEPPVAGRTVFRDTNGNGTLDSATVSTFTTSANLPIPDNDTTGVTSSKAVSGLTGTITDVDVTVNITHPYVGDLRVSLVAPDGTTTIPLANRRGGSGQNFTTTVFDDAATTSVAAGSAPFTGRFRPESPLGVLNGTNPNGTWQLKVVDAAGQDIGTLDTWTLAIASGLQEPFVITTADGNAFLDLPAGANAVHLVPQAGWKFTSPTDGKYAVTAAGTPLYDRRFGVAEAVPPTVASVSVTPTGGQRSRVTSLTVTFSERVVLPATPSAAFTLTRAGGGAVAVNATVDNTGPATVVTLTFTDTTESGSLTDGRYTLTVLAAQVRDVAQNPMAANHAFNFHRLYGDWNGDASVTLEDYEQFGAGFGLSAGDPGWALFAAFDFNADGTINLEDYEQFGNRFGTSI